MVANKQHKSHQAINHMHSQPSGQKTGYVFLLLKEQQCVFNGLVQLMLVCEYKAPAGEDEGADSGVRLGSNSDPASLQHCDLKRIYYLLCFKSLVCEVSRVQPCFPFADTMEA